MNQLDWIIAWPEDWSFLLAALIAGALGTAAGYLASRLDNHRDGS